MTTKKGSSNGKAKAKPKAEDKKSDPTPVEDLPVDPTTDKEIENTPEDPKPDDKKAPKTNKKEFPHKARAKKIFDSHKVNEIHFTTDGQAFIEPQHARMHAETLKYKTITPIKREEV